MALGVPVKIFTPADYDGVIQGLLGGTLDMAWMGASGYAKIALTGPKAVEVWRSCPPEVWPAGPG